MLNGRTSPAPIVFRAGVANRLRLINITSDNVNIVVRLVDAGETSTWTPRAQDGAELPRTLQISVPARTRLTVGSTFDVEVAASGPAPPVARSPAWQRAMAAAGASGGEVGLWVAWR